MREDRPLSEIEAELAAKLPKSDAILEAKIRAKQAAANSNDAPDWDYGNTVALQRGIDSGSVWGMEGSAGRAAMRALERGECFLPLHSHKDYYGNTVPCRTVLKPGSHGTLANSAKFWGIPVRAKKK